MNKILSIIVPSYNVEKYIKVNLQAAIDSNRNDIEVIVIDDGSTDNTGKIADEICAKYPDIIKVIHKKNGGYGSGVNTGIRIATGKYTMVVDADDSVISTAFNSYVEELIKCDADLVLNNFRVVDSEGNVIKELSQGENLPVGKNVKLDNYIKEFDPFKYAGIGVHTQCTKTTLLKEINESDPCHEHRFYTDREYTLYVLRKLETVYYCNLVIRNYLIGRPGQSADRKKQIKNYQQACDVTSFLRDYYYKYYLDMSKEKMNLYLLISTHHDRMCYSMQMSNYNTKEGKSLIIEHDKWVKNNWPELYKANKYLPINILRKTHFIVWNAAAYMYKKRFLKKQKYL